MIKLVENNSEFNDEWYVLCSDEDFDYVKSEWFPDCPVRLSDVIEYMYKYTPNFYFCDADDFKTKNELTSWYDKFYIDDKYGDYYILTYNEYGYRLYRKLSDEELSNEQVQSYIN